MTDEEIVRQFGELPTDPKVLDYLHKWNGKSRPLTQKEIEIGKRLANGLPPHENCDCMSCRPWTT